MVIPLVLNRFAERNAWPLRCGVNTLGYSLAAAKVAQLVAHRIETVEGISGYYPVIEMGYVAEDLKRVIDPEDGTVFQAASIATLAAWFQAKRSGRWTCVATARVLRGEEASTQAGQRPTRPRVAVVRAPAKRKRKSP